MKRQNPTLTFSPLPKAFIIPAQSFTSYFPLSPQYTLSMDDDIFFIPDTISIMSKLKEPPTPGLQEHSLSKIIREQALHYEEENFYEQIRTKDGKQPQGKTSKTDRKQRGGIRQPHVNPEVRPTTLQDWNEQKQIRADTHHNKLQRRRKEQLPQGNHMRSPQRKGNLMLFDEEEREQKAQSNSKKQKRDAKVKLDQQKTKKIQFQDIDRYKPQSKKQDLTKIRHNDQNYDDNNLGLSSKENSEALMDSRDLGILTHRIISNYNILVTQIKEQMAVIRFQHIEIEKIDIRKMISKLEGDIRRIKIGFRGQSDSLGKNQSNLKGNSKLKGQESRLRTEEEGSGMKLRRGIGINKVQSKMRKDKSPESYARMAYDYGGQDDSHPQNQQTPSEKLEKLEENMRNQRTRQNKFTAKLHELQKKYNILRTNNMKKEESLLRRTQANQGGGSIIKRSHLLKEKIAFLKNELKETKAFYSNKIKRLKNQNTILNNENIYITKEITESKLQVKQKKTTPIEPSAPKNLMIFDEIESSKANYRVYDPSKVVSTSNKDLTSGIASINDVKSLQSINSAKSINIFHSKPSLGSINSYKSTKIESIEKKKPLQSLNNMKNKLKIKPQPHLSPPSLGEMKQNSFLKRLNNVQKQQRGVNLSKKSNSLDVAIKELQEKYSKHLQERFNEDEYYQNYK